MSLAAFAVRRAPRLPAAVRWSAPLHAASSSFHSSVAAARPASSRASLRSACVQQPQPQPQPQPRIITVAARSFSSGAGVGSTDSAAQTAELIAELQSLQVRPDTDTAAVERVATSFPSSAWTRTALHVYLGCFDIVPDGAAALAGFRRIVAGAGLTPLPQSYAKLVRAILYDWTPHHAESLDQVRADMLAQRPVLRFSSSDVGVMLPSACAQPDTARRLQQWAKEDGVWDKLQPPVQRRLAEACQPPRRW